MWEDFRRRAFCIGKVYFDDATYQEIRFPLLEHFPVATISLHTLFLYRPPNQNLLIVLETSHVHLQKESNQSNEYKLRKDINHIKCTSYKSIKDTISVSFGMKNARKMASHHILSTFFGHSDVGDLIHSEH